MRSPYNITCMYILLGLIPWYWITRELFPMEDYFFYSQHNLSCLQFCFCFFPLRQGLSVEPEAHQLA